MKNRNFGFTLIELLVVIVIIGILATISTATFSGYFAKSRDTERQSFIRNAQQIIIADQVTEDSIDYTGYTTATLTTLLQSQGYDLLTESNGITAHFLADAADSGQFLLFVCSEDALGTTVADTGDASDIAFVAGTAPLDVDANAGTVNATTTGSNSFEITGAAITTACADATASATAPVLYWEDDATATTVSEDISA